MYFLDDDDLVSGDKRHQRRVLLMQLLFARTFGRGAGINDELTAKLEEELATVEVDNALLAQIDAALPTIDAVLAAHAPERPLSEINQVDLAIMRLIVFESQHSDTPKKVLVDEAVELAKAFGSETSAKFVNGVLGQVLFSQAAAAPVVLASKEGYHE